MSALTLPAVPDRQQAAAPMQAQPSLSSRVLARLGATAPGEPPPATQPAQQPPAQGNPVLTGPRVRGLQQARARATPPAQRQATAQVPADRVNQLLTGLAPLIPALTELFAALQAKPKR